MGELCCDGFGDLTRNIRLSRTLSLSRVWTQLEWGCLHVKKGDLARVPILSHLNFLTSISFLVWNELFYSETEANTKFHSEEIAELGVMLHDCSSALGRLRQDSYYKLDGSLIYGEFFDLPQGSLWDSVCVCVCLCICVCVSPKQKGKKFYFNFEKIK